jgi:hypothetical protein
MLCKKRQVCKLYNMTGCKRLVIQGPKVALLRTGNVMQIGRYFTSATLTLSKQFMLAYFQPAVKHVKIVGAFCLQKKILSQL